MAMGQAMGLALETLRLLCSLSTSAKVLSQMPGNSTPTESQDYTRGFLKHLSNICFIIPGCPCFKYLSCGHVMIWGEKAKSVD